MVRYRLGTLGYGYADWQGPFYPGKVGANRWLGLYAGQFDSLELNTTFHAMPTVGRLQSWASRVGPDFRFAVKVSRAITHEQALATAGPMMLAFVETVRGLGNYLGPVLIQLPPHVSIESFGDLERLLGSLPVDLRYAVEFRHRSWVADRTTELLRRHNVAWVGLDHVDHPGLRRLRETADFLYVRLVGKHQRFETTDRERIDVREDLRKWNAAIGRELERAAGRIKEVWVMVGNGYGGHAPATARQFASIAGISLVPAPVQAGLF
jgi:uncharacterized protein YecE (DUF72 family)